MKIVFKSNQDVIQPDWGFTLFFTGMACLYKFTYIQLALQFFIIAYVFVKKLTQTNTRNSVEMNLTRAKVNDILFFCIWLGIIAAMLYISGETYAIYKFRVTNTALTTFRIFTIGLVIFYYIDSKEMALSLLEAFVIGTFVMSAVILMITSPSSYFDASMDAGFGEKLAQHRNQVGAACATSFIMSYYLQKYARFKVGYMFAAFFAIVTVLTGSRGGMLQLVMELFFILFLNGNFVALFFFIVLGGITVLIIKNVPILYENVWVRFMNAADTLSGNSNADGSTLGREYYKEIAWKMFQRHPIRGYGVDGFKGYLATHPIYKGSYLPAVYSHCNFSELMSSLGIIGLLSWYLPTFSIMIRNIAKMKYNKFFEMSFVAIFAMTILDYARIPWASHLGCYPFILIFALSRHLSREYIIKKEKVKNIDPSEQAATKQKAKTNDSKDDVHFVIVAKEEND